MIGRALSWLFPFRPAAPYAVALRDRTQLGDWKVDVRRWDGR